MRIYIVNINGVKLEETETEDDEQRPAPCVTEV
jgi:hypothetical protein